MYFGQQKQRQTFPQEDQFALGAGDSSIDMIALQHAVAAGRNR